MSLARQRILPPYTQRVNDVRHVALKAALIVMLVGFAMFMGFWLAVFGTLVTVPFVSFIAVLLMIALWMAPDTEIDLNSRIQMLFYPFAGFLLAWPAYLAMDIPGLPWMTPTRVLLALCFFLLLLQLSQARWARAELANAARQTAFPLQAYAFFIFLAFATIAISAKPGQSAGRATEWAVMFTGTLLIAIWVLREKTAAWRFYQIILCATAFVFLLTLGEFWLGKPVWADHIPSFLTIDGPLLGTFLGDQSRATDGRYRVRGIFGVHLYFAQFITMAGPFLMHAVLTAKPRWRLPAIALLILSIYVAWLTNTRTAMLGIIIVLPLYLALFGFRRFLRPRGAGDIVAPSTLMAVPLGFLLLIALVASSHRLQTWTIGGSQHKASNDSRSGQWERSFDLLLANPLGYGGGNSAQIAGILMPNGVWLLDSMWLNLFLDYGFLGGFAFLAFGLSIVWYGVKVYLQQIDDVSDLAGAAAVGIVGLLLTMLTISFVGNFQFLMLLVGLIVATRYRLAVAGTLDQPETAGIPAPAPVRARAFGQIARSS